METELWPNLLDQAHQFNVPSVLLNARLSEKSAKGYAKVKGLTRGMLKNLTESFGTGYSHPATLYPVGNRSRKNPGFGQYQI